MKKLAALTLSIFMTYGTALAKTPKDADAQPAAPGGAAKAAKAAKAKAAEAAEGKQRGAAHHGGYRTGASQECGGDGAGVHQV